MIKKLRKATICAMMTLVILAASFETTAMTAQAADPFWNCAYLDPGKEEVTFYIDINRTIKNATLKSWDFSSDTTFLVSIYSPSGAELQTNVLFGSNDELPGRIVPCYASGKCKVVFKRITGNAGGWVGAWLY